jgi:hypothetical protein
MRLEWRIKPSPSDKGASARAGLHTPAEEKSVTQLRPLAAAAVRSVVMVAPAMAQQVYHRGYDGYGDRGPLMPMQDVPSRAVYVAAEADSAIPLRGSVPGPLTGATYQK